VEGPPAKLIGRLALAVALLLGAAGCSDEGDDASDPSGDTSSTESTSSTAPRGPDLERFCAVLADLEADDPFAGIFGNDNPMTAAAAFDTGAAALGGLVAYAPEEIEAAATEYAEAFDGYRAIVLPDEPIDAEAYRAAFDELVAREDAARAELDAYAATSCVE
jgi:hypothetical protein